MAEPEINAAPSNECRACAKKLMARLLSAYGIAPYKVTDTPEQAVYMAFTNPRNQNVLRVEVDDELDAVAVVSDGNSILESGILVGDDIELSVIRAFDTSLVSNDDV